MSDAAQEDHVIKAEDQLPNASEPVPKPEAEEEDLPVEPERATPPDGPYGYFGLTLKGLFQEAERLTADKVKLLQVKELVTEESKPVWDASMLDIEERWKGLQQAIPRKASGWFHKINEYKGEAAATDARIVVLREIYLSEWESWSVFCHGEQKRMADQLQYLCEAFGYMELNLDDEFQIVVKPHHTPAVVWKATADVDHFQTLGERFVKRYPPSYAFKAEELKPLLLANAEAEKSKKDLPHPNLKGLADLVYKMKMKFAARKNVSLKRTNKKGKK